MSDTQFLDLTNFSGLLDRVIAGLRSAPPTADQQRWMAGQVGDLLEEIAARAPAAGEAPAGEWEGFRTGERLSLSGPGNVQISVVMKSNEIQTARIDLEDVIWQIDVDPVPDIVLRITTSRGHKVQSAFSFSQDGEARDDRDWNAMLADTAGQLEKVLQSTTAPDFGDAASAGALPGPEEIPVSESKRAIPMPDVGRAVREVIEPQPVRPVREQEGIEEPPSPIEQTVLASKPPAQSSKPQAQWALLELAGPETGKRHPLIAETVLGRKPDCDIMLDDPLISRKHARITQKGQVYAILDLGSRNGTFVNGRRIQHEVLLSPGDQVRLGDRVMQVSLPAGKESPALATVIGKAPLPAIQPKTGMPPQKPGAPSQRQASPAKPVEQPLREVPPLAWPAAQPGHETPPQARRAAQPRRETPPPAPPAAPPPAQPATVTCSQCGTAAKFGINFCRNCGSPLTGSPPVRERRCPHCRQPVGAGARFCRHCGRNLPD
jgi:hypothetical protein